MWRKIKKAIKKARRKVFKPYFRGALMRLIVFYQKNLSRHSCLYEPTCSEYAKRVLNNKGVILGLILTLWRLLRCNPFSKGGYDPAPEKYFALKWVI